MDTDIITKVKTNCFGCLELESKPFVYVNAKIEGMSPIKLVNNFDNISNAIITFNKMYNEVPLYFCVNSNVDSAFLCTNGISLDVCSNILWKEKLKKVLIPKQVTFQTEFLQNVGKKEKKEKTSFLAIVGEKSIFSCFSDGTITEASV